MTELSHVRAGESNILSQEMLRKFRAENSERRGVDEINVRYSQNNHYTVTMTTTL